MNLKKQFHINIQVGKGKDRERFAVSINKLHTYIGKKRADFIIKNMLKMKCDKKRYSVQGICLVDVYFK